MANSTKTKSKTNKQSSKQTLPKAKKESSSAIKIQGARVNTLKNVSCDIPKETFTVITGPSGSGKSSLAFDTLYAEGQRRYIESMSSYARQFLARIEKPDVESIEHVLPSIALEQKNSIKNARSTVGTATEVYDYLRALFANIGKTRCHVCGGNVSRFDAKRLETHLKTYNDGDKVLLLADVNTRQYDVDDILTQGFSRVYVNNKMVDIETIKDTYIEHASISVVVDRLIIREGKSDQLNTRLKESIGFAINLSGGQFHILNLTTEDDTAFRQDFACVDCLTVHEEPTANLFSFNSPVGACTSCEGYGRIIGLDYEKVIPNKDLTIEDGAVHPFTMPSNQELFADLLKEAKKAKIPVDTPYRKLTEKQKAFLIEGKGDYPGIRGFFNWLESKKYKVHVRVMLAKYRGYYECPDCEGSRIKASALNVTVQDAHIKSLCDKSIGELRAWLDALQLDERDLALSKALLREINHRVDYLNGIGLSYLTLSRQSRTLSGGEAQRINLSTALGCKLTDTLYVLDEPTVGLHARDTDRLLEILGSLRDHGNTVLVVEHDPDVMLACDHIIDMGPGGGDEGGRIIFEGTPKDLLDCKVSKTATYLSKPPAIKPEKVTSKETKPSTKNTITIKGARGNNLQNIDVSLPKNQLVCVTGVSGSGKSSLIKQTLYAAYQHSNGHHLELDELPHTSLSGLDEFEDVILVDQTPPGRSARSNPATFVKAYDDIRQLFAATRTAQTQGITAGAFSFNSAGGRCEQCEGLGTITIDMQFMADVTVTCPDCQGKRFTKKVLNIEYADKTIDDVLNMTIDDAVLFFGRPDLKGTKTTSLVKKLMPLVAIGLGYLKLGQSTATLSGGEAQRLKLAGYLKGANFSSYLPANLQNQFVDPASKKAKATGKSALAKATASAKTTKLKPTDKPLLFLFDEPTTGLHMADIEKLTEAFRQLIATGHSVVVVEHNIDFIARADWVVDLGPEGGSGGGLIVAEGTVNDLMKSKPSLTGQYLKARVKG